MKPINCESYAILDESKLNGDKKGPQNPLKPDDEPNPDDERKFDDKVSLWKSNTFLDAGANIASKFNDESVEITGATLSEPSLTATLIVISTDCLFLLLDVSRDASTGNAIFIVLFMEIIDNKI